MEKLVYVISGSQAAGRKLRFELIKTNIRCTLFNDAESAVLNALFNKPDVIVYDTSSNLIEMERLERLLTANSFQEGFRLVKMDLMEEEISEDRQRHSMLQRMRTILRATTASRRQQQDW
jgi:hypothetical protein